MSARFTGVPNEPSWESEEAYNWLANDAGIYADIMSVVHKYQRYGWLKPDEQMREIGNAIENGYASLIADHDIDVSNVDWDSMALWFMDEE